MLGSNAGGGPGKLPTGSGGGNATAVVPAVATRRVARRVLVAAAETAVALPALGLTLGVAASEAAAGTPAPGGMACVSATSCWADGATWSQVESCRVASYRAARSCGARAATC